MQCQLNLGGHRDFNIRNHLIIFKKFNQKDLVASTCEIYSVCERTSQGTSQIEAARSFQLNILKTTKGPCSFNMRGLSNLRVHRRLKMLVT